MTNLCFARSVDPGVVWYPLEPVPLGGLWGYVLLGSKGVMRLLVPLLAMTRDSWHLLNHIVMARKNYSNLSYASKFSFRHIRVNLISYNMTWYFMYLHHSMLINFKIVYFNKNIGQKVI